MAKKREVGSRRECKREIPHAGVASADRMPSAELRGITTPLPSVGGHGNHKHQRMLVVITAVCWAVLYDVNASLGQPIEKRVNLLSRERRDRKKSVELLERECPLCQRPQTLFPWLLLRACPSAPPNAVLINSRTRPLGYAHGDSGEAAKAASVRVDFLQPTCISSDSTLTDTGVNVGYHLLCACLDGRTKPRASTGTSRSCRLQDRPRCRRSWSVGRKRSLRGSPERQTPVRHAPRR